MTRIPVVAEVPYEVVVGDGLLGELAPMLGERVRRVGIICPASLRATGESVREDLAASGLDAVVLEVPDGEEQKTPAVAAFCWEVLGTSGFTRTDAIVGIGGGATTDLAGFVAATWLRGIRVVHVPTTLLGMVDAAVGGKTGINTPQGKNLVGSIHEPAGVLCDLSSLASLPRNDLVAGLAEVIKVGLVRDPEILRLVEDDPEAATRADSRRLRELIERAIRVKADVVGGDLHERVTSSGDQRIGREVLNYGHTFGHAIENVEGYSWRHGAAVSVGMVYVAELARLAGRLSDEAVQTHRRVLEAVGLPTAYAAGRWEPLLAAMQRDKKSRGNLLRFVVLDRIGHPGILEGPDPGLLVAAYEEVSA